MLNIIMNIVMDCEMKLRSIDKEMINLKGLSGRLAERKLANLTRQMDEELEGLRSLMVQVMDEQLKAFENDDNKLAAQCQAAKSYIQDLMSMYLYVPENIKEEETTEMTTTNPIEIRHDYRRESYEPGDWNDDVYSILYNNELFIINDEDNYPHHIMLEVDNISKIAELYIPYADERYNDMIVVNNVVDYIVNLVREAYTDHRIHITYDEKGCGCKEVTIPCESYMTDEEWKSYGEDYNRSLLEEYKRLGYEDTSDRDEWMDEDDE